MNCFAIILIFVLLSLGKWTIAHNSSIRIGRSLQGEGTKQKTDWCKLNCKDEKHIGCLHKKCRKLDSPCELVKFDEEAVLAKHNKLRNTFAKGGDDRLPNASAADMMLLNWDIYLAYLAACNLKPCKGLTHDQCHGTEKFAAGGQNLASKTFGGDCATEATGMIENWYNEIKYITQDDLKDIVNKFRNKVDGNSIGHFTQVVWSRTTHIGCALRSKPSGKSTDCILACNYGPGGNIAGGRIYLEGEPASKCPKGLSANDEYKALCGKAERKQDEDPDLDSSRRVQNLIVSLILPLIILIANL